MEDLALLPFLLVSLRQWGFTFLFHSAVDMFFSSIANRSIVFMDCFSHEGLYSEMNKWKEVQRGGKNTEKMGEHDLRNKFWGNRAARCLRANRSGGGGGIIWGDHGCPTGSNDPKLKRRMFLTGRSVGQWEFREGPFCRALQSSLDKTLWWIRPAVCPQLGCAGCSSWPRSPSEDLPGNIACVNKFRLRTFYIQPIWRGGKGLLQFPVADLHFLTSGEALLSQFFIEHMVYVF